MNIAGIITARGGSKGLPGKNVRALAGKPLVVHTIEAALASRCLNRCIVSTDDREIKSVSLSAGAEVIDRPDELAEDKSLSRDVVLHALQVLEAEGSLPDYFILLQPTSPLRNSKHIDECVECFFRNKGGSCISVTLFGHHSPFKALQLIEGSLVPLTTWHDLDTPRQQLPEVFRHNGAMYITSSQDFIAKKSLFIEPVIPFVMGDIDSVDIDCQDDLDFCEQVLKNKR